VGSIKELGYWKDFKVGKMKWNDGHIWRINLNIPKNSPVFMYKYVIMSNNK
jgi:hypothetical protein